MKEEGGDSLCSGSRCEMGKDKTEGVPAQKSSSVSAVKEGREMRAKVLQAVHREASEMLSHFRPHKLFVFCLPIH